MRFGLISLVLSILLPGGEGSAQSPVFTRDIAPIIFANCSGCHRPGEPAPFSLLTYDDAAKRSKQILDVVENRIMPPWLPVSGHGEFSGERRLSEKQISEVREWTKAGAPQGDLKDLPALPQFTSGWQLGLPDLIVSMPETFRLPPEGMDTYRNFVIPLAISSTQNVAAIEFRPGTNRAVHHAFFFLDRSGQARKLDAQDVEPGFPGLHTSARLETTGFFMSWQPGKIPSRYPQGMSWPLQPGTDLVLQLHLQHTGKEELIRPKLGLYFTNQPPKQMPMKFCLRSMEMDIPPGERSYVVSKKLELPGNYDLLGIVPHAHYLARRMQATATLPGGEKKALLLITNWNFNWQGDYAYQNPVFLPKGTVVEMAYTFDNSEENPHNPSTPPKRVQYGLQSTDEMAEFWMQLLPRTVTDRQALDKMWARLIAEETIVYNQFLLKSNAADNEACLNIGRAILALGRTTNAIPWLHKSLELKATPEAYYNLGLVLEELKRDYPARQQYEAALRLDSAHFKSRNNLGLLFLKYGEFNSAEANFLEVLKQLPNDGMARQNLELTRKLRRENPPKK